MKENLTDKAIVQRFFDRDEDVLTDVENRYGSYLFTVANNILQNTEDSKECVNDTYLSAWQKIPPHRPPVLLTFLSKITRGHAIDRWRQNRSLKRGGGQYFLPIEELADIVAGSEEVTTTVEVSELAASISKFLAAEGSLVRQVFVCRYFYCDRITDIARMVGRSEGGIKAMLHRTRAKLREELIKEGWFYET